MLRAACLAILLFVLTPLVVYSQGFNLLVDKPELEEAKQQEAKARTSWKKALKFAHYDYPVKQQAKKQLE